MPVINTEDLTKYYGKKRGIINVNLSVEEGEFFGFIGPNGAGKSTTIRLLLNFIFPSSGTASIFGHNCVKQNSSIKKFIGYVPSEVNYYRDMKVIDLLNYSASFYNSIDHTYFEELLEKFEIETNKRIGSLSLGSRKKVSIIQALLHRPKLLILDEPANGLDPLMQNRLFETLIAENRKGTSIFLSSHNLVEVQRFCHRVAVIREGRIIETKKVEELLNHQTRRIVLRSGDSLERIFYMPEISDIRKSDNLTAFVYTGSMDKLIKELAIYTIDDIRIEEPTLEDTFIHYYEGRGPTDEYLQH